MFLFHIFVSPKEFNCRISQVPQLTIGGVALNFLVLQVLSCPFLWSYRIMARTPRFPGCPVCSEPGHWRSGPRRSWPCPLCLPACTGKRICPRNPSVVLISSGSDRGRYIGLSLSFLFCLQLIWKCIKLPFVEFLILPFIFSLDSEPLNHQIWNSDTPGKCVK